MNENNLNLQDRYRASLTESLLRQANQTQEFLAKQNVTFTRLDEKGNVYHD